MAIGTRTILEKAIALGRSLGDRHAVGFEEVYRGEALLVAGEYRAAQDQLERLAAGAEPGCHPACPDAADADDDGRLGIGNPLRLLGSLFLGEGPLCLR